jgi:MFS transporter, DHA1 family, multidrug resistance protein
MCGLPKRCAEGEHQTLHASACPTSERFSPGARLAGGQRPLGIPPLSALEDDALETHGLDTEAQAVGTASGAMIEPLAEFLTGGPGDDEELAAELAPDRGRTAGRTAGRNRAMPTGWRQVALIGTMSIFGPLCIDMYLPALPQINRDLHASASEVQLTLTACLIGIALGQLLLGPISDRVGRRLPLIIGLASFVLSSLACAVAPNIWFLVLFRLIQGMGGAAGIVIARSIVRDLHSGVALAKFFATLMLATGVGPVFAPQIGSWILAFTSWRGVFIVLAIFGVLLFFSAWFRVPETLPPDKRQTGSVASTLKTMGGVLKDRVFLGYVLACGLGMGATFAYIAGSSFVLENIYRLSPLTYGLVFALNACGLIIGAQVSGKLTVRVGTSRLLTCGLVTMVVGGALLFTVITTGAVGLAGVIPSLFIVMFGFGFVGPNAAALAMQRYPNAAGSAAAVLGSFQFGMAALIAPLAGAGGTHDATPMISLILGLSALAVLSRFLLAGSARRQTARQAQDQAASTAVRGQ